MTDRIDEILRPSQMPVSEGPSSDSYIAKNLRRQVQEVVALTGKIINIEPEDATQISKPSLEELSIEAYKSKLVVIGNTDSRGSSKHSSQVVTSRPIQLLRLDDRDAQPSNKMVDLVRFRNRGKSKRKLAV